MDTQTPQVQVPGETPETQPEFNAIVTATAATVNHHCTEVEMGGTQDISQPEPEAQEDSTLLDVQAELELPAPAKKNAGFNFLE
ncbi:hypothetical protein N7491_002182 [Penicillium cf. griseofulvum]|uniref:Uncharacterized protein n=1 Tax=Penicillium cf. griseofulvum TaxID=2972120 RepID=A0A9W9MTN3_9EURO|nr:hypothetical protein N7472_003635 [Penicillium cf. griseofulvum]KAJ5446100.1 hypothetical protein N7491_002182 [Penicillium cf. griseofulvum]KAJ5447840.1 hypothetical protein N7445_002661 [Penicillium cf. griseofulvum]